MKSIKEEVLYSLESKTRWKFPVRWPIIADFSTRALLRRVTSKDDQLIQKTKEKLYAAIFALD